MLRNVLFSVKINKTIIAIVNACHYQHFALKTYLENLNWKNNTLSNIKFNLVIFIFAANDDNDVDKKIT